MGLRDYPRGVLTVIAFVDVPGALFDGPWYRVAGILTGIEPWRRDTVAAIAAAVERVERGDMTARVVPVLTSTEQRKLAHLMGLGWLPAR